MKKRTHEKLGTSNRVDEPSAACGEGFLRRWARRKALPEAHQGEFKEPTALDVSSSDSEQELGAVRKRPSAHDKTDADMPPIDTLDESSDFSGFLSPKVSDELRQLALRKLFHLPKFNVTDGLDDYAEDFRTFETLGTIVTADMRHQMERLAELATDERSEEPETADADKQAAPPSQSIAHTTSTDWQSPAAERNDVPLPTNEPTTPDDQS